MQNKNPCIGCDKVDTCVDKCAEWEAVEKRELSTSEELVSILLARIEAAKNCLVCVDMSSVTADTRAIVLRAHSALEGNETEAGGPAPKTFNEIFAKFDAWYWDKYRHHPEEMVVEQFYKFLNREAV